MKKTRDFEFWVNDKVINPLGQHGIIKMVGVATADTNLYFVSTSTASEWWPGYQLTDDGGQVGAVASPA